MVSSACVACGRQWLCKLVLTQTHTHTHTVFGVYPRYTNQPKDANVRDWNVTELAVSRRRFCGSALAR